jgi:hypothetical protein
MSSQDIPVDESWHRLSRTACEDRGFPLSVESVTVTLVEGDQFWLPGERTSVTLTDVSPKHGEGIVAPRGTVVTEVVCFDDGTRLHLEEFRACLQAGLAQIDDAYPHVDPPEDDPAVFVPFDHNGPTPQP